MTAQQRNHPKKGDCITVEPIRDLNSIKEIKEYLLLRSYRDYALFSVGVNTAFRASDLLKLKVGDVRGLQAGDSFMIKQKKRGKNIRITVNSVVCEVVKPLIAGKDDNELLFSSRLGCQLTVETLNRMVKSWCRYIGLKGNFGSHTLRKTWVVIQHEIFGMTIERISEAIGHSNVETTFRYACIQKERVRDIYLNAI